MPQRYCPSINLIKFICAIGIIWVHQSAIIENYTDFPFASNGTLVELFYSITGLLTYSHFYYQKDTEDIMHYCAKKFIRLFPYSCFSIISCFLISNIDIIMKGSIHNLCYEARDLPLELLLLRNAAAETTRIKTYDGILWFMSAMFIVLPLFCFVCTVLKKHALMISVLFCELWYMSTNAQHYSYDWQSLCRAMAGLMLGVIIFHIALRIEQTRVWGGAFPTIEILNAIFIIITLYKNYNIRRVQIVSFIILMSIAYSQKGIRLKYNENFIKAMGDFSMIMYFTHPIAQRICLIYFKDSANNVSIYLFLSFVLSALAYISDRLLKRRYIKPSRMGSISR